MNSAFIDEHEARNEFKCKIVNNVYIRSSTNTELRKSFFDNMKREKSLHLQPNQQEDKPTPDAITYVSVDPLIKSILPPISDLTVERFKRNRLELALLHNYKAEKESKNLPAEISHFVPRRFDQHNLTEATDVEVKELYDRIDSQTCLPQIFTKPERRILLFSKIRRELAGCE